MGEDGEEEKDDYMSMTFGDSKSNEPETSLQRRARLKREGEVKSRQKSKAELRAEEELKRHEGLQTSLDASNKGFRMMSKMGFKGGALGKTSLEETDAHESDNRRTEPIALEMKDNRGGIGMDAEKKRKFREEMEKHENTSKKAKADENDYRERLMQEKKEKRLEGQFIGAMKVAEKMDEELTGDAGDGTDPTGRQTKPLQRVNVLWRGAVKHRLQQERDRRMRHDLARGFGERPSIGNGEEDADDRIAMGLVEEELDEEDAELDEFNALDAETRLTKLIEYLREQHRYCYWCKMQYHDATMEGCPGKTEEDHD